MKYFTQNWHNGNLPEKESDAILQSYWKYIEEIAPELPQQLVELATKTNLHDGLIRRVILDENNAILYLKLRCGDAKIGYFDLDLEYKNLILPRDDKIKLKEASLDPETEILYDEIDISNSGYAHRILFWPFREVDIYFSQLAIAKQPAENRKIPKILDRFVESHH